MKHARRIALLLTFTALAAAADEEGQDSIVAKQDRWGGKGCRSSRLAHQQSNDKPMGELS